MEVTVSGARRSRMGGDRPVLIKVLMDGPRTAQR